jgi:Fe-S cluster biogenesis protein NfuA
MDEIKREDIVQKINDTLDKIRPYLIADGGNVTLEEVTQELDVKLKLTGACGHCPFSMYTLKAGVEQALLQDIPQIRNISAV